MIRPATTEDGSAVIDLVVTAGMFSADDAWIVEGMLADYFGGKADEGHVCLIDDEGGPLGVAYYQPRAAADRVWDLTMIAVRPVRQGRGRGTAMVRHVEEDLRAHGGRLLLVETSGLPQYDRTRTFYLKCGYEEEARIRDYWAAGDDLVVFRKALDPRQARATTRTRDVAKVRGLGTMESSFSRWRPASRARAPGRG